MISFVSGIVDSVGENDIIVDVNGIGYQVYASATALAECGGAGSKIRLCTYMYIREDEVSLYGFSREEERILKKLTQHSIFVYGTFIFGYDSDTEETFNITL